jgi:hypothetical protein
MRSVEISFCILVATIALIVGFERISAKVSATEIYGVGMRLVIGVIAVLVLASIFGSIAGLVFWPQPSSNLAHSEQRHSSEN